MSYPERLEIESWVEIASDIDFSYQVASDNLHKARQLSEVIVESHLPLRRRFAANRLRQMIQRTVNYEDGTDPIFDFGKLPLSTAELAPKIIEHKP